MSVSFFKRREGIRINDILSLLKLKKKKLNVKINDIKDLYDAKENDISFFHSNKYLESLVRTKAKFIITNKKIKKNFKKINFIEVENVMLSVAKITSLYYPNSVNERFDSNVEAINKNKFKNLNIGKNVLIGKNVKIGKNCSIGHNTIIEQKVIIGDNCNIGSNVILKNTVIGNNTRILDGAIIGKKGFGFFPGKINILYPHIGKVVIGKNVEIGCNNTIDRGSLSDTVIGDGTFIDNQVHIAHNVKIGKNCIITGQVGFAGSSRVGNKVIIGGQTGISGHINVGSNVQIGGGSGVIKNIPSNTKVMGYPAKDIRKFLKENK